MSDDELKLMPSQSSEANEDKTTNQEILPSAVASQIIDNIEDNKTLREWRPKIAIFFAVIASIFYIILLCVIVMLISSDGMIRCAENAPNVCITVLLILAIVPTLLIIQTSKAVFGRKSTLQSSPYTPMQALIHLLKELKN